MNVLRRHFLAVPSHPTLVGFVIGLLMALTTAFSSVPSVEAVACQPPERGNYTLSSSCTFPNSTEGNAVDGVFQGDMVIPENVTLTINAGQTVCFDPDSQVLLEGGNIAINETGQLKECYVTEEMMGNLDLDTYGSDQPARIYQNNLFVCTSNPCTATAPSAAGNVILEGVLKMVGGSPGAGKILTSDANGVASWEAGGSTSGWTDDGASVRLTTITDNVGIGTTNPGSNKLSVNGFVNLGNTTFHDNGLEINDLGSGNRMAIIDLHGDDTYTDYAARLIRYNTGANAPTEFLHRGTGILRIAAVEAAPINVLTNNTAKLTIDSTGSVGVGTTGPVRALHVQGGAGRFRSSPATDQGGNGGQLTITDGAGGTGKGVWMTFHREAAYAAQFGLETDNWFSTRGRSAGTSGYTALRTGGMIISHFNQPWFFMADTNTNDWGITSVGNGADGLYFYTDINGDGILDTNTMIIGATTTTLPNPMNLECTACVDQSDLKTTTAVYTSAVTAALAFSPSEYNFFPNIEKDTCTPNGGQVLRPYPGNAEDSTRIIFWVDQGCSSGVWAVRVRYVSATRDPEIFGWYDPENDIIQSLWVAELPLDGRDHLPLLIKNEEHPTWIPVQATIFDRDLARYGQPIDSSEIINNYTFTRIAKASELSQDDELVKTIRDEHDRCLEVEKHSDSLDDPEAKCPQLMTHTDVYYGKLERSDAVAANWQRHDAEKMAWAEQHRFTTSADLAENYAGATDVTPGEIIAIDRAQNNFLVRATAAESQQLAGVVSTSPGQVLGEKQENNIELALVGRVPVKMSASSLPVQAGDMITVSAEAGKGMKATQAGWVVGKALESWSPNSGQDTVLVLLNTSVYDPQMLEKSLEGYTLVHQADGDFRLTNTYNQIIDRVIALKELLVADLTAGVIKATRLEVAGVDIEAKLNQLDRRLQTVKVNAARTHRPAQAVGNSTLPSTSASIFVSEPRVTAKTIIFLTSRIASDQHLAVTEIQPGVGFMVSVAQSGQAIPFDYWLVK